MTLVLVFSVSDVALADQTAKMTVSGTENEITAVRGEKVELTVSLEDCEKANTLGIEFSYDDDVLTKDIKIGEWVKEGTLQDVDDVKNNGVWAVETAQTLDGDVFKFTFKVLGNAPFGETEVAVKLIVKDNADVIGTFTDTVKVNVVCEHAYGEWTNKDANNHAKVCKNCNDEVTEAHKWDAGKVTQAATATKAGTKTYTCTACKATKTESIPVTGEQGGTTPPSGDSDNQGGTTPPAGDSGNQGGTTTPDDSEQAGTTTPDTETTTPDTEVEGTEDDTKEPDTEVEDTQKPDDENNSQQPGGDDTPTDGNDGGIGAGTIFTVILIIGAIAGAAYYFMKKK